MQQKIDGLLVPKLRFPEFRDAGGWQMKKLIEICERISQGGTPDTSNPNYWNGSIEWLTPAEMGKKETRFIQATVRKITKTGLKNCSSDLLPINSVIISTRAPIGHLAINKSEMAINQGCKGLVPKESTSYDFLYHSLLKFKASLTDLGAGNTFKELTGNSLKNFEIPFPNLLEQKKIADCLSSTSDRITAETQKLDTLKAHKKGLMQQLFPAEGETLPKLRFPDFLNSGEWKEQRIEDLSRRGSGHTPNKNHPNYYNCGIKWVSLADSNKLDNGYIFETKSEISKEGLENSSAILHPPGTVIVSRDAGVGKSAVLHSEMAVSQHFIVWRCDDSKLSNWFLYYLLQVLKPTLEAIATGSTIKTIGLPYFKKISIAIPSITEQQKIADSLYALDELITTQTKRIDILKTHKKGLMQQLFPALDEVKG